MELIEKILSWIDKHPELTLSILAGIYDIVVCAIPTKRNLSIIDKVYKAFRWIIQNRRKPQPEDVTKPANETKNQVWIKRTIHKILTLFFVLATFASFAQTNGRFKSIGSYNTDSLTVKTETTGLEVLYGNIGMLYYNRQSSKWRVYQDSVWYDLLSGGGSGGAFWPLGGPASLTNDVQINSTDGIYSVNLGQSGQRLNGFSTTVDETGSQSLEVRNDSNGDYAAIYINDKNLQYQVGSGGNVSGVLANDTTVTIQTNSNPRFKFLPDGSLEVNGSVGTAGQFISSQGAGLPMQWASGGGGGLTGTLTTPRIPYASGTSTLSDNAAHFWDAANTATVTQTIFAGTSATTGTRFQFNGIAPQDPTSSFFVQSANGTVATPNAPQLTINGGSGYLLGNGNGGNLVLRSGTKTGTGLSGTATLLEPTSGNSFIASETAPIINPLSGLTYIGNTTNTQASQVVSVNGSNANVDLELRSKGIGSLILTTTSGVNLTQAQFNIADVNITQSNSTTTVQNSLLLSDATGAELQADNIGAGLTGLVAVQPNEFRASVTNGPSNGSIIFDYENYAMSFDASNDFSMSWNTGGDYITTTTNGSGIITEQYSVGGGGPIYTLNATDGVFSTELKLDETTNQISMQSINSASGNSGLTVGFGGSGLEIFTLDTGANSTSTYYTPTSITNTTTGFIELNAATTITLNPNTGDIILNITRASCSGAPTGSLANIGGVLNICP